MILLFQDVGAQIVEKASEVNINTLAGFSFGVVVISLVAWYKHDEAKMERLAHEKTRERIDKLVEQASEDSKAIVGVQVAVKAKLDSVDGVLERIFNKLDK